MRKIACLGHGIVHQSSQSQVLGGEWSSLRIEPRNLYILSYHKPSCRSIVNDIDVDTQHACVVAYRHVNHLHSVLHRNASTDVTTNATARVY